MRQHIGCPNEGQVIKISWHFYLLEKGIQLIAQCLSFWVFVFHPRRYFCLCACWELHQVLTKNRQLCSLPCTHTHTNTQCLSGHRSEEQVT
jgi:hypothetical protein